MMDEKETKRGLVDALQVLEDVSPTPEKIDAQVIT